MDGYRKYLISALLVLSAVTVACLFLAKDDDGTVAPWEVRTPEVEKGMTLNISVDPELVYTKAFWRRPGADDEILHAERLEWTDRSGAVVKWQWFLVIEPSAATWTWLATNPFSLTSASNEGESNDGSYRPEWFPADLANHDILESPDGHHKLATSRDGKQLYATDSGFGFTRSDNAL